MFLAEDDQFPLDNISALEQFAIHEVRESKRYDVENSHRCQRVHPWRVYQRLDRLER